MSEHRDIEVGAALRGLGRPDHEKDFFPRLFELMDAEEALAGGVVPDAAPAPKTPRRWFLRRPFVLATTATAVAAVVALVTLVGLPFAGESGIGTGPATAAAQMLAKFSYAMANAKSLSGIMVATGPSDDIRVEGTVEWRVKFVVTSDGDFRADAQPTGDLRAQPPMAFFFATPWAQVDAYDARSHTRWWLSDKGALEVVERAGTPIGPPLWRYQSAFAYQNYASTLKALLDEGELDVEETEVDGRPAWRASYFLTGRDTSFKAGTVTLFVDRETGLLVRYTLESSPEAAGSWLGEMTPFRLDMQDLRVNDPVDREVFRVPTEGVREKSVAHAYLTFGSLPKAAERVEFDVLVPSALPEGFELAEVCSYRWEFRPEPSNFPWAVDGQGPISASPPHNEINLVYRRGLDWICIEEMPSYPKTAGAVLYKVLKSPLMFMGHEEVRLDEGTLAGITAHTWLANVQTLGPGSGSGLIALSRIEGAAGVRITGTLSRSDLLEIANSLEPYAK